ncbi:MAG: AMIN domain-containing protein [Gemmatimonadetes bacterium]|nr:AMIN domain-containing protein [Gemmatimonadota bacterium]
MTSILTLLIGLLLSASELVTGVSVVPNLNRTDILVAVDGSVSFRAFSLESPPRIVVDLLNARHALSQEDFLDIDRGGVLSVRTSQYADDIVRVVVDLEGLTEYTVEQSNGAVRISLDNPAGAFAPWESPTLSFDPVFDAVFDPAFVARAAPFVEAAVQTQEAASISVLFPGTPIDEVLFIFAEFSGKSIVAGTNVSDIVVTADIRDQAWDDALEEILQSRGLVGIESATGIIRVNAIQNMFDREAVEPLETVVYPIAYLTSGEVAQAVGQLTSERGQVAEVVGKNSIVVTDIRRVHEAINALITELDTPTPQIMISAKIIFVNRSDLKQLGISYDLKDSQGNQLNVLAPGAADLDGDGVIEVVPIGTNVFSLGGNSIAALGNAESVIASPTLRLLTSLVIGRHTLINFVSALESSNLSDIQAAPSVTVADNQEARIQVGERTPIRTIDAAAGGAGDGAFPTATVAFEETGIILTVTPHITGDQISLDLRVERSAADFADSDIGLIFRTQNVTTKVLVYDGETVVMGGLTVTERIETRSGIPLLMNLPLLGGLFRTTAISETQRDLMILVTPNIVRRPF